MSVGGLEPVQGIIGVKLASTFLAAVVYCAIFHLLQSPQILQLRHGHLIGSYVLNVPFPIIVDFKASDGFYFAVLLWCRTFWSIFVPFSVLYFGYLL